jgi:hypothetical protein
MEKHLFIINLDEPKIIKGVRVRVRKACFSDIYLELENRFNRLGSHHSWQLTDLVSNSLGKHLTSAKIFFRKNELNVSIELRYIFWKHI